jgi:hypothetical protein
MRRDKCVEMDHIIGFTGVEQQNTSGRSMW